MCKQRVAPTLNRSMLLPIYTWKVYTRLQHPVHTERIRHSNVCMTHGNEQLLPRRVFTYSAVQIMEEIAIFRAVTHHASCVDGGQVVM